MTIDGRALAAELLLSVRARAARLPQPPVVAAIAANETPATASYLAIKKKRAADAGCALLVRAFEDTVTTEALREAVREETADAVLVQLPLPAHVDARAVCDAIPKDKDADVLSAAARAAFTAGAADALLPPVVSAVEKILAHANVPVAGRRAVVVGKGFLVGAPVALWLAAQGASVHALDEHSPSFREELLAADIIVSGAGVPRLITEDMVREGVVLVDAGTADFGGTIAGDTDPLCAKKAAVYTPVPGGVGPLAVSCLFENAVFLAERKVSF
jgi:methylenetetrahydrofolate dehydrogenase (NADP+)/methenyltetrahydrofolate cyclohydrolase